MYYIISQIFSTLALVIFCISMWQKDKTRMVRLQILEPFAQIIAQIFLGGWSGVYANAVSLVRNFFFLKGVRHIINFTFVSIFFAIYLIFIDHSLMSIFPIIASIIYSYGLLKSKDVASIAIFSVFTCLFWLVYNIYLLNIAAIINNFIALTNNFFVLYRYHRVRKNSVFGK